jgi:transposase
MATPYSQDLRDRVLGAYDRGMKTAQIARVFDVSPASARRLKQTRREEGRTTPLKMGGAKVFKIDMQHLAQLVKTTPDATIEELRASLIAKSEVRIASSAVWKALRRLDVSYKKRRCMPASRIARTWRSVGASGDSTSPRSMLDI